VTSDLSGFNIPNLSSNDTFSSLTYFEQSKDKTHGNIVLGPAEGAGVIRQNKKIGRASEKQLLSHGAPDGAGCCSSRNRLKCCHVSPPPPPQHSSKLLRGARATCVQSDNAFCRRGDPRVD